MGRNGPQRQPGGNVADLPRKTTLYRELQGAQKMGMEIPELAEKTYMYWTEAELEQLHNRYLNPDYVEHAPEPEDDDDLDSLAAAALAQLNEPVEVSESLAQAESNEGVNPALNQDAFAEAQRDRVKSGQPMQTYTDWVSEALSDPRVQAAMAAQVRLNEARSAALDPAGLAESGGIARPELGERGARGEYAVPRDQWGAFIRERGPQALAVALGVPFNDRKADRAGLTFNTHGPNDILRIDSRGMVWFRDEVMKPAIPQKRMRRKVKTVTSNIEEVHTYRPDGGIDETFEVAGDEQHEIEIKISMPTSQVGIYVDPRMPFKIHQYGNKRAFDYDEVVRFYGGLMQIPSSITTIYVDIDLCFDIASVRDTMEKEYREQFFGRSLQR
jgi:hypothetical protein